MRLLARFTKANFGLAGVAAACLLMAPAAQASEPPLSAKKVRISVPTGRPVAEVLTELYGQAGLRVKVSSAVTGNIAGTFAESANKLWDQIARSKNLVAFYDGSVVRVYSASEITSRNFTTTSPENVLKEARRQNLIGTGNSIKSGAGSVTASGVPAFLDRISQIAANAPTAKAVKVARSPKSEPAMIPITPSSTLAPAAAAAAVAASDIVSPINTNPALASRVPSQVAALATPAAATDYTVLNRPSVRDPFEIRLYRLKYANASDSEFNLGDRIEAVPGVATLLNQLMGYNGGSYAPVTQTVSAQGGNTIVDGPAPGGGGYGAGGPYYPQQQVIVQKVEEIKNYTGPRIVADQARNTVMVKDLPSQMTTYDSFIKSVDIPHIQLQIDVVIVDLDRDRTRTLGIDWEFGFNALRGLFGGQVLTSVGTQSNVNAAFVSNNGDRVSAKVSALSENGYLKIVKQQQIFVRTNEVGTMDNRQTLVIPFSGQFNGGIRELRVGTFLSVKPTVTVEPDSLLTTLRLDVRDGRVADGSGRLLDNSQISTTATVPQGESIIIGGITIESEFESNSKVPIAGDIPIAGQLFRRKTKGGRRIERVVIITPRVMSNEPIVQNNAAAIRSDGVAIPANSKKTKKGKRDKKEETISLLMNGQASN
jgi:type III secretion protein C